MKTITVLGSTGSIGTQTLEIAKKHGFRVKALAAYSSVEKLAEQALEFHPEFVCIYKEEYCDRLRELLNGYKLGDVRVLTGMQGLCNIAELDDVDIMLNSVVGMVGLEPTLRAIDHGRDVALANKETLVAGGQLVMDNAKKKGVRIFPVDSEHSAIFQCLQGNKREQLNKIILTASGGPFYGRTKADLENVSVEQALAHPNWSMGRKITVDSATLMNKGLEFIEAMWLFGVSPEQIEVVVHRESVIHSAVEYKDHSVIAQMGVPDMKIPIQYALLYPDRLECPTRPLSLTDYGKLTFSTPDYNTFDCLTACIRAITIGGTMPAMVNGANEAAVAAFLDGRIRFLDIGRIVSDVLNELEPSGITSLEDVLFADRKARNFAIEKINKIEQKKGI